MLKNKFSPTFFLTAVIIIGLAVSTLPAIADIAIFGPVRGKCDVCGGMSGNYYFLTDTETGEKRTVFLGDDGKTNVNVPGHKTFKNGSNNTLPPAPTPLPDTLQLAVTSAVYDETSDDVIINTNSTIAAQVIDMSTGNPVSEKISINEIGVINVTTLSAGCKYVVAIYQQVDEYGYLLVNTVPFCKR
ncbi:MAG: hypothetical protein LBO69_07335 [Ignavibacteria bacterium]|jgi:hypothetical protein|nr:hypothetical protein [Ignavibacteria bacterium]